MRQKNPLLIVLGVCGGCVLLGIIVVVIMGALTYNKGKNLFTGVITMEKNMPAFLYDVKAKDYAGAETLIDPTAQGTLTTAKIQKIEEAVEKKLGPMQSFPASVSTQPQTSSSNAGQPGKMPSLEYTFQWPVTYKKGTATAIFKFNSPDMMNPSGKITGFKIEADDAPDSKSP